MIISPFSTFQYIRMLLGLAYTGGMYSRMLDVAIKEEDRDFWKSYLDDILTSAENLGHISDI